MFGKSKITFDSAHFTASNMFSNVCEETRFAFAVEHSEETTNYCTVINPSAELNTVEDQGILYLRIF